MLIIMDMSTGQILEGGSSRRAREEAPDAGWADVPQALPRLEEAAVAARSETRVAPGVVMGWRYAGRAGAL